MAYTSLTNVAISLQDTAVTGIGFGTPMFASTHRFTKERVKTYNSLTAVATDFPTDSEAYIAATKFFGNTPSPTQVKLGRREADLDITVATGSTGTSFNFHASNGTTDYTLAISVTGQVDEDAVATAIQTAIEGDADIGPLVTATVATNVVSITPTGANDSFWVDTLSSELSLSYQNEETAANLITNIDNVDSNWYFFTAADHTNTFVLAAAAVIEAQERMYFTSSQETATLTTYNESTSTDTLANLRQNGYDRTHGRFHHDADTTFPECAHVGYNAPFDAGSANWANLQLNLPVTQNPTTGLSLSVTEKGYLESRNASYIESIGANNVVVSRGGKVAGGSRISTVHGRDNMTSDMNVTLQTLLINQQGGKLSYTNGDIAKIYNKVQGVLDLYVERDFIRDNYEMTFLLADQVPVADKAANIYQSGSFKAELSGEIDTISLTGTLVLDLSN